MGVILGLSNYGENIIKGPYSDSFQTSNFGLQKKE
jgi:hypothetical protein